MQVAKTIATSISSVHISAPDSGGSSSRQARQAIIPRINRAFYTCRLSAASHIANIESGNFENNFCARPAMRLGRLARESAKSAGHKSLFCVAKRLYMEEQCRAACAR